MSYTTQGSICWSKKIVYSITTIICIVFGAAVYGYIYTTSLHLQKGYKTRASDVKKPNTIRGGIYAKENEFPFYVDIVVEVEDHNFHCGGSLISESHILTAYHCIEPIIKSPINQKIVTYEGKLTFLIGVHDYLENDRTVRGHYYGFQYYKDDQETSDFIVPTLIEKQLDNGEQHIIPDFALIKLQVPAKNIPTVSIVPDVNSQEFKKLNIKDGLITNTIGNGLIEDFGRNSDENIQGIYLKKATIELRNSKIPEEFKDFSIYYFENTVDGSNSCGGDSGSPVVLTRRTGQYVIAITSFGAPCSLEGANMGFYTNLSLYSSWIASVTGITPKPSKVIPDNYIKTYPPLKELGTYCSVHNTTESNIDSILEAVNKCYEDFLLCTWDTNENKCVAK